MSEPMWSVDSGSCTFCGTKVARRFFTMARSAPPVAGPFAAICDECVGVCNDVLAGNEETAVEEALREYRDAVRAAQRAVATCEHARETYAAARCEEMDRWAAMRSASE